MAYKANLSEISVVKRNLSEQLFSLSKIVDYINKASVGLKNINQEVIIKISQSQFFDHITTAQILDILIYTTTNLISETAPDYQYLAARFAINQMRREVWHAFLPKTTLFERVKARVQSNIYDSIIFEKYSPEEFELAESIVDYDNDFKLTYSGVRQFYDKYLIKNRITNTLFELPQEANILICMYMFMNEDVNKRFDYIRKMYKYLADLVISLPTPIYSGVRTKIRSFSSCCVLDVGDTVDSIVSTNYIIAKSVVKRYGIGCHIGKIRALGSEIQGGQIVHSGILPFLRMYNYSAKSFMQGAVRGGSTTYSCPFFHQEIISFIELKNNKGNEQVNRLRNADYSIGLNKLFIVRALKNQEITLFSPHEVPLLANDYRYSHEEFTRIYEAYENDPMIKYKTKINALEFLKKICRERYETGRIYIYFMDSMNQYGVFKESIFSSNLCQEIALPAKPCDIMTGEGLVAVCILSSVNIGRINNWQELEEVCEIIVRFLNEMIDYQDYDCIQIKRSATEYRPLGIGLSDYFHWLAKRHLKYDTIEARDATHELAERFQYYLLMASCKCAQEKGACKEFNKSKYSDLILPVDKCRYKPIVDTLISNVKYVCNWELLRNNIKQFGLRNCCVSAVAPTASSSSVSSSTPGIDCPKHIITSKLSKYGVFKQVVLDYEELKDYYTFQKDLDNTEYFKLMGVIQKFIDQGMSTNSFYMYSGDVSIQQVVNEIVDAYKYGLKTLYYLNSNKNVDEDINAVFSNSGINKSFKNSTSYNFIESRDLSRESIISSGSIETINPNEVLHRNADAEEPTCNGDSCTI